MAENHHASSLVAGLDEGIVALLRRRAKELAHADRGETPRTHVAHALAAGTLADILLFEVAGERFAVETRLVREASVSDVVLPLPSLAPPLLGVTGVRGRIVAVYDTAALFGLVVGKKHQPGGALLVLHGPDPTAPARTMALRVDDVLGVRAVPDDAFMPPPANLAPTLGRRVQALVSCGDTAGVVFPTDEISRREDAPGAPGDKGACSGAALLVDATQLLEDDALVVDHGVDAAEGRKRSPQTTPEA